MRVVIGQPPDDQLVNQLINQSINYQANVTFGRDAN